MINKYLTICYEYEHQERYFMVLTYIRVLIFGWAVELILPFYSRHRSAFILLYNLTTKTKHLVDLETQTSSKNSDYI